MLGATAFNLFTQPHSRASRARSLLGGYAVGTIVGLLFAGLRELLMLVFLDHHNLVIAGVTGALGIVITAGDLATLAVVLLGVSILYGAKTLLRNYLFDLR